MLSTPSQQSVPSPGSVHHETGPGWRHHPRRRQRRSGLGPGAHELRVNVQRVAPLPRRAAAAVPVEGVGVGVARAVDRVLEGAEQHARVEGDIHELLQGQAAEQADLDSAVEQDLP